ncbi:MAG: capsule assembly Wzi family protein, partial [Gammaproteobacteria bacterium]|nr:capsule assembly Wzi family protein [Gammaproteobacteria bacterium]
FAGTSCRFYSSRDIFNCAYNHPIYRTGYRYRGRSIGHSADNDARVVTAGLVLIDDAATSWHALARFGVLNRGGPSDARQSLTPTEQDFYSLDVTRRKEFRLGIAEIGVGLESIDDIASGESRSDFRGFLQWTSAY